MNIAQFISDYQSHIWYIEFVDLWITTDKSQVMNIWDIEKETKAFTLSYGRIKHQIVDIVALDLLKLIAVASLDKLVTIWNFYKQTVVLEIDLSQGGVQSMIWANSYQTLITVGYENVVKIWTISPQFLDATLIGKLIGHLSMITAIEYIENTAMLITADDIGSLKVWDIRNFECVQTIESDRKAAISCIISAYEWDKLYFLGSRINFIRFDRSIQNNHTTKEEQVWPIHVEYNSELSEIIIVTRKDVIIADLIKGTTKRIYRGLLLSEEDEITSFKLVQQDKKFILGDQRGRLCLFSYANGEQIKSLACHHNEVSGLKVDYLIL